MANRNGGRPAKLADFDPTHYEQMAIPNLLLGKTGANRGQYFVRSKTGIRPLISRVNSAGMAQELLGQGVSGAPLISLEMTATLENSLSRVRARALETKKPFNLTLDHLLALYEEQSGKCKISGIPMRPYSRFNQGEDRARRNPWAPSVDRIDNAEGYVIGNVQLTCIIANIAKSDFGEEALLVMCAQTILNRQLLVIRPDLVAA
jgi:hypothetical protein